MRQRCGPIQCVSIEDGSAMQESYANTPAAPKLVNRPSTHTLRRPGDLGHGYDKTSQSGPSTRHNCPSNDAEAETESRNHESAPENVIATQKKKKLLCVSVNTPSLKRIWHNGRYLLFSSVATHIDKDHQRQHVMGTAQDADKEACVRGRKELRQNTRRTDASEHQLSASSPMRKKTQKSFPVQRCANTKQGPHGTLHRHKQTNFTSPHGVSRRGILRHHTSHTDLVRVQ